MQPLDCQRARFDIPPEIAYLNCGYMAPLARSVREAGERGVGMKSRPWELSPADFFDESEVVRGLFATLVEADPDDVAIVPSVSYGAAVAARHLTLAPRRRIVVLADQFPSNVYPWRAAAAEAEAEVRYVARPVDGDWTSATLAALDESVALVAVPHCHWVDGAALDLGRLGVAARRFGARFVVDATQSLGALPLSVRDVRPDYLLCAAYKWLLGPYSMAFLYVAPEHHGREPIEHNWIARSGSEDFAGLVSYRDTYQPGARRFDVGERSNFALMPMVAEALRLVLEWGPDRIAWTLREVTGRIVDELSDTGIEVLPAAHRAPHYLGLKLPSPPGDLADRLAAESIFVSVRGDRVRVTPHVYNTVEDVDRFIAAMRH